MMQLMLSRLSSIHQALRTDEVVGESPNLPKVGECWSMVATPIAEDALFRLVRTSTVKEVRLHPEEGSLEFWTENSHYGLQVLDMDVEGGTH